MSKEQEKPVVKVGGSPLKSVNILSAPAEEEAFVTFGKSPLASPKQDELPIGRGTVALSAPQDESENVPEDVTEEPEEVEEEIDESHDESHDESEVETEEEDEDINPYEFLGKQLQSDGFLDRDFEIKKDIQGTDLYNAYSEKLKKEIEPQIKQAVYGELAEQGINEQDLVMARLIRSGVDVSVLQNSVALYEKLANYNKNAEESDKETAIRHMYATKGYSDDEAEVLISRAKDNEKFDDLYATSSKFFEEKYKDFVTSQIEQTELQRRQYKEFVEKQDNHIKSKLSSGEIYGEKIDKQMAKEIQDAIYRTDDVLEIEGKKYPASKFHKFMTDFNNDPELRVWAYKKWAYRGKDMDSIKKQTEKELEEDFLGAYKKTVLKTNKKSTAKAVKNKQQEDPKRKSYIIEF